MMFFFVSQQRAQHHPKSQPTNPALDFVPARCDMKSRRSLLWHHHQVGVILQPDKNVLQNVVYLPKMSPDLVGFDF